MTEQEDKRREQELKERALIEDGRAAQAAYDRYIEPFFTNSRERMLAAYEKLDAGNTAQMTEINQTLRVMRMLETDLRTRMAKGKATQARKDKQEGGA